MQDNTQNQNNGIKESIADREIWDELLDTPESKEMMNDMVDEAKKAAEEGNIEKF